MMISTTSDILKKKGLYDDVINIIDDYLFGTKEQNKNKIKKIVNEYQNIGTFQNKPSYNIIHTITNMGKIFYRNRIKYELSYVYQHRTLTINEMINKHQPYMRFKIIQNVKNVFKMIKYALEMYKNDKNLDRWLEFNIRSRCFGGDRFYDLDDYIKMVKYNCDWDTPIYKYKNCRNGYDRKLRIYNNMDIGDYKVQENHINICRDIVNYKINILRIKFMKILTKFMKNVRFYKHYNNKKKFICCYDDDIDFDNDKIFIQQNKSKNNKNVDLIFENKIEDNKWEIKTRKCELKYENGYEYIVFRVKGYGKVVFPTYLLMFKSVININNTWHYWRELLPKEDDIEEFALYDNEYYSLYKDENNNDYLFKLNNVNISDSDIRDLIRQNEGPIYNTFNLDGNNTWKFSKDRI